MNGAWPLALRLAWRELRGAARSFRFFLACLTLGVAAIAGVGSLSEAMLGGLRADGRVLLGGDIDLSLSQREINPAERAWIEGRAEVSVVTKMRSMARALTPEARRTLIDLRAVDALYPMYGTVGLAPPIPLADALAFANGSWGAVADAALLRRLDLADPGTGAPPRIRLGEAEFEIRAVLTNEPDRAERTFAFGPHVLIAAASLAATDLVQPGSMMHRHYRLRLPAAADMGAIRAELAAAFPEAGWRIRDARNATPGISQFISRLSQFLTMVGLTALLVGGLGVGNAVRSYLESRRPTIATLKCLGAPGALIFRVYLLQILALAALGITVGLALGAGIPYLLAAPLNAQLGWSLAIGLYPGPMAAAAAFGVLTAVAFSLWPLAHARATPAASLFREIVAPGRRLGIGLGTWAAIAVCIAALAGLAIWTAHDRWLGLYFVLGAAATFAVFHGTGLGIVALARRSPRPRHPGLRLALANLHRPGAPTVSAVASLGLGLTVLIAIALVEGNLTRSLTAALPEDAPAFYFIDIQPDQVADFERIVAATPGARDLRRVPMLRGRISTVNGKTPDQLTIPSEIAWVFRGDRGLTWSAQEPEGTILATGRWWPADYAGPPLLSLESEVGQALGIGPGDRIGVNVLGREFEAEIANLRTVEWQQLSINFVMVFSPGLLENAPQTYIATVKADGPVADALERAVTDRFANVTAVRVKEALAAVAVLVQHIAVAVRITAGVAVLAGLLVLAGAIAAGHRRRVYDAVVLKVLGATRPVLARAFLLEYGLLGALTAAVATAVGSLTAYLILSAVMHMPFAFLPASVAATAGAALAATLTLGLAGTWRALGQRAAPLLRNE
ncbi:MAG TPA: FtsX-like permease family protein [Kiloniellales bacterium]|jgi:putative ABC transport system permease protein